MCNQKYWSVGMGLSSEAKRLLFNWALPAFVLVTFFLCWGANGNPNEAIYRTNNTVVVQGFYNTRDNSVPLKPPKKRDTAQETQRALFLICGVILGVPIGVLAACGVREFACAMYEKYRLEALRRNYLYRMKIPTTVPVR